jgi:hypothetical protein
MILNLAVSKITIYKKTYYIMLPNSDTYRNRSPLPPQNPFGYNYFLMFLEQITLF